MKNINLKELPDTYISSGMSLEELANYLNTKVKEIKKWETFFSLPVQDVPDKEKFYTKDKIQNYIKIKNLFEKGRSVEEIREKLPARRFELISNSANPFEKTQKLPEFKLDEAAVASPVAMIRPFLTQLNKNNQKIEKLLVEKTRIIENTAIEKARLVAKLDVLKAKNAELENAKEQLATTLMEKEQEIKRHFMQESALGETLMITQKMLKEKEEELVVLREKISEHEKELWLKDSTIHRQSNEIDALLEKQNKKWWKFWH